ncbi:NAD-dependent epimerase/dehydratase family protein [Nocardiopsis sp. MG754419]|uniref:NAD-dependent epimerase/dehydratase family protein n=1 Tax=Nocardiopsis sp. MG754419 TaxID=2259865 RepID=UPI001BAACB63|nr:NAD-dependent epimerase/dehydratase family protein [Nocardiopsis sp. MG754419]MBR8741697.1 reductase [Nocardiopsis sp. MG754419]
MRLLVLGGTEFVGRAVVEEALGREWEVTVFHRGRHDPPAGTTVLHGDRTEADGLDALATGEWDAVVDTWSGAPAAVAATARLLADRAGHYAYVSSRSVYGMPTPPGLDEDAPTVEPAPADDGTDYARAKRGGEVAAQEVFGDRALCVRAGLILGPHENIGRLPWWLNRIARGGTVLAPGPRELPLQYVDARDLATWTLDASVKGLGGPYNLVSPLGHTTTEELLTACREVTGSDAELCWVEPEPIVAAGVRPWMDLPIWLPPGESHETLHQGDVGRALATGLRCRPVAATVADTWAWLRSLGGEAPHRPDRPRLGLDPEVERRVLEGLGTQHAGRRSGPEAENP